MKKQVRNFLILSTLTTMSIYAINKAISISSGMKNLLKTDLGRFYDWRYGKIYYTKKGKGTPLVLVHDLEPASSSCEWEKIEKQLAKNHTVYTIDLLGCGRSDKPNLTYTNYMYVQLLTDFVKNIVAEKADIISMGGSASFTVMACNMNPIYFNKLIFINPLDLSYLAKIPSKRKNMLKFLIDMPVIGTMIYNIVYSATGVDKFFRNNYYYNYHLIPTRVLDTYYEASHLERSRGKYLLSSINANYTNINIVHALKKVDNSIYLICSKENEYSDDIIKSYSFYNPSIESALVERSKYLPQLESPDRLMLHLNLFLES